VINIGTSGKAGLRLYTLCSSGGWIRSEQTKHHRVRHDAEETNWRWLSTSLFLDKMEKTLKKSAESDDADAQLYQQMIELLRSGGRASPPRSDVYPSVQKNEENHDKTRAAHLSLDHHDFLMTFPQRVSWLIGVRRLAATYERLGCVLNIFGAATVFQTSRLSKEVLCRLCWSGTNRTQAVLSHDVEYGLEQRKCKMI
jgi:hypothetical protein